MHEISSFKSLAAVLSHGAIVSLTVLLFLSWPVVATSLSASSAAATWYLAPDGSDGNGCTVSAPCFTFARGYRVASPGDTVIVTCGRLSTCRYPDQMIPYQAAKSGAQGRCVETQTFVDGSRTVGDHSACVTFRPSAPASVTVGTTSHSIVIEVPYVRITGLSTPPATRSSPEYGIGIGANPGRTNAVCSSWSVHDVVVDGVSASVVNVSSSSDVFVVNSRFGPHFATTRTGTSQVQGCSGNGGGDTHSDHLVFAGDTWHDYFVSMVGAHTECLHWDNGDVGVIARSRFENCGQQDVSIETQGGSAPSIRSLLVEDNYFDRACSHPNPGDPCGVVSGGTTTLTCHVGTGTLGPVELRFNSYDAAGNPGGSVDAAACTENQITFEANLMAGPTTAHACSAQQAANWHYVSNVFFNGVACGVGNALHADPTTVYAAPSYPSFDYSELPGAPSLDFVPGDVPRPETDITGAPRVQGKRADAGAFER